MEKHVLVPFAEGFEEIEAITIVDVLRRAGVKVTTAGLKPGVVTGAHGIAVTPDTEFGRVDLAPFDMLVLPGGMPGSTNLKNDPRVIEALRTLKARGKHTAAICAAPIVLAHAGVLAGERATCYPGFEKELGGATFTAESRVVKSGRVITSRGAGTALEFALALVEELVDAPTARRLAEGLLARA